MLLWFCKYVIHRPRQIENENKHHKVDQSASVIAQHIVQAVKRDRQVSHDSEHFRVKCETPLSAGLALSIHQATRSKELMLPQGIGLQFILQFSIRDRRCNSQPRKRNHPHKWLLSSCVNGPKLGYVVCS